MVYHASDDLALHASKASNLNNKIASRRLGHTGPEDIDKTPKNVYSVDCDDVNNSYDLPKGHSYFVLAKNQVHPVKSSSISLLVLSWAVSTLKMNTGALPSFETNNLVH